MTTKGTPKRNFRVPGEAWQAASEAFPSEPGTKGGLPAELRAFTEFLAERPDDWRAIKALASEQGVDPWRLIADTLVR